MAAASTGLATATRVGEEPIALSTGVINLTIHTFTCE